jgi:hypothetical protein
MSTSSDQSSIQIPVSSNSTLSNQNVQPTLSSNVEENDDLELCGCKIVDLFVTLFFALAAVGILMYIKF